jgi:hypothetical protein
MHVVNFCICTFYTLQTYMYLVHVCKFVTLLLPSQQRLRNPLQISQHPIHHIFAVHYQIFVQL